MEEFKVSKFQSDLNQETILSKYLDDIYQLKAFSFFRIHDINRQYQGVDVEIIHNEVTYLIDEKAQLHYLNKDLLTFTFELSYLKGGQQREGWLFDKNKGTDYYFLVTGIMLRDGKDKLTIKEDIQNLKITSINRTALLNYLAKIGLTKERLSQYNQYFRQNNLFGKQTINELNVKTQGCVYFTKKLSEQPINLQLKLNHLIEKGVAKRIYG